MSVNQHRRTEKASIRVCFASAGRFHTFDVARHLNQLGSLEKFYTGYPPSKVVGVPRDRIRSFSLLVAPWLLMRKWGLYGAAARIYWAAAETFDLWVERQLVECDVFHCMSSFGLKSLRKAKEFGAAAICERGSSHILHQEGLLAEESARWGVNYRPTDPRVVERELREYEEADRILVPSEFAFQTFVSKGIPREKLGKIPYGVDLSAFRPIQKEDDVFRVIYVGGLNIGKGIPYLLEAVSAIRLPRFEVWLIGRIEPGIQRFLAQCRDNVRCFGHIPKETLYKYYSQGSVFVFASLDDGFGLVQLEAMACGLPVITTTNTGGPDFLRNGVEGFIIPIRDAEAIRDRILFLYEHPEVRRQMSDAALRRARSLGGWEHYSWRLMRFYSSVLTN